MVRQSIPWGMHHIYVISQTTMLRLITFFLFSYWSQKANSAIGSSMSKSMEVIPV
jgi:hypothetical protein